MHNKFGYTGSNLQNTVNSLTNLYGWMIFAQNRKFNNKVSTYLKSFERIKKVLKDRKDPNSKVLYRKVVFLQKEAVKRFAKK
jgi:hypothetical protein